MLQRGLTSLRFLDRFPFYQNLSVQIETSLDTSFFEFHIETNDSNEHKIVNENDLNKNQILPEFEIKCVKTINDKEGNLNDFLLWYQDRISIRSRSFVI